VRIVLDTNVLVSGLISPHGPPAKLVDQFRRAEFVLITSSPQLHELRDVLARDCLRRFVRIEEAATLMANLDSLGEIVRDALPNVRLSPDPDDNLILATAIAGKADFIVSGDKGHMISLQEAEGIPIITPAQAMEKLGMR